MNRLKIYLAAAIFFVLTLVKLAVPSYAEQLRETVMNTIDRNDDITGIIETVGSKLSGILIHESVYASSDCDTHTEEAMIKITPEPTPEVTPTYSQTPTPTPEPSPEAVPEPQPVCLEPERVTVFKESQLAFSGYNIPDNVSCDMPQIPFEYTSPVAGYSSSGFGYREHPIDNVVKFHYGTDFAANSGENVCAFADGYVYAAGTNDGYGNYLIITHDAGYSTIYGHLSEFVAHEGDMVSKGQVIGLVGSTGKATGPHLHFELLCNDIYLNPEYYV